MRKSTFPLLVDEHASNMKRSDRFECMREFASSNWIIIYLSPFHHRLNLSSSINIALISQAGQKSKTFFMYNFKVLLTKCLINY